MKRRLPVILPGEIPERLDKRRLRADRVTENLPGVRGRSGHRGLRGGLRGGGSSSSGGVAWRTCGLGREVRPAPHIRGAPRGFERGTCEVRCLCLGWTVPATVSGLAGEEGHRRGTPFALPQVGSEAGAEVAGRARKRRSRL